MKALVLGGYGNFGARVARALAGDAGIELVIAGRDASAAKAFARTLPGAAGSVALDSTDPALAERIRSLAIELVIHTAGPFQAQGYDVAFAAARAGAHYIDLADGRRFVCDFAQHVDAAFRAAGRCAITGASTVPALSSAVVDHLSAGWQRRDGIEICIAPAQHAPRGLATLAAVLSYCGEPVQVWQQGRWVTQPGWAHPRPVRFARLRPRAAALCDIPDLELLPALHPDVQTVWFGAALELPLEQHALAWLARARMHRLVPRPDRLAPLLHRTARLLDRFGSALGGMFVRVEGLDAHGLPARRSWHIAADHDSGPEIPCMAAILLARELAMSRIGWAGARAAARLLPLSAFEPEFARWQMVTDLVDDGAQPVDPAGPARRLER